MNSLLIERGNRQKKDKNFRLPDNIFHFHGETWKKKNLQRKDHIL